LSNPFYRTVTSREHGVFHNNATVKMVALFLRWGKSGGDGHRKLELTPYLGFRSVRGDFILQNCRIVGIKVKENPNQSWGFSVGA